MDEEKKSEASWEERTQLGPYQRVRRMARAFDDNHESRHRWRLGLVLASAAAVCPAPRAGASGPRVPTAERPGAPGEHLASAHGS